MNKPHVICHMLTSKDGKVTGKFLGLNKEATKIYYGINRAYKANAFACGRITMEESFTGGYYPDLSEFKGVRIPYKDHIAKKDAEFFAVAFDRKGRLGWKTAEIIDDDPGYGGAHIIEVLCSGISQRYLAYLRSIGVSYIFAGKGDINLNLALDKLHRLFGIKTLLLEGGSIINGAFRRDDLIDEISLVVSPLTAEETDKPLFYGGDLSGYRLIGSKPYGNDIIWLNYRREIK